MRSVTRSSEGGLMSYSANFFKLWQRTASYVDRILKGTHPAELPIEQATEVHLNINVKLPLEKYPASVFRKFMIVFAHPVSARGTYRGRHEREAGMRWTRRAGLTSRRGADERNRVVLISRRWDQVCRCHRRATEANKP